MVSMISEEGRTKVGIYEYVIDTATELSQVPTDVQVGSIVYCIENSKKYMLDSSGSYVEVNFKKGGSGGEAKLGTKDIDENGSYKASDFNLDGWSQVNVNISSGGSASNIVTGEFTTSSTAGPETVSIPYNGEGYPIRVCFYCDDDSSMTGTNRCVGVFEFYKSDNDAPTYTGTIGDSGVVSSLYRYSTTATTRYTYVRTNTKVFSNDAPSSNATGVLKIRSKNSISIYVDDSNIGFPTGTKYRYFIEYSS